MIQSTQIQEFVAETRERYALMTTRRYQRGSICKSENGEVWYGKYYPAQVLRRNAFNSDERQRRTRRPPGSRWTTS